MDKNHQQTGICHVDDFLEYEKQVDCGEASARTQRKILVKVKSSSLVEPQINSKHGIRG